MTVLGILVLLAALLLLGLWARHDNFTTRPGPTWFD